MTQRTTVKTPVDRLELQTDEDKFFIWKITYNVGNVAADKYFVDRLTD